MDASGLVARVNSLAHVAGGRLWNLPYQRLAEKLAASPEQLAQANQQINVFRLPTRNLWKARVLHLMGRNTGPRGAIHYYQLCRPSNDDIDETLAAGKVDKQLAALARRAKQDAGYWLGLLAYERGLYEPAIDYFRNRTLKRIPTVPGPRGPITIWPARTKRWAIGPTPLPSTMPRGRPSAPATWCARPGSRRSSRKKLRKNKCRRLNRSPRTRGRRPQDLGAVGCREHHRGHRHRGGRV